jgi:hypothetical protein
MSTNKITQLLETLAVAKLELEFVNELDSYRSFAGWVDMPDLDEIEGKDFDEEQN